MTKNESNMNGPGYFARKVVGWLLIGTAAGILILGTKAFVETNRQMRADEYGSELRGKLTELEQLNCLIHELGAGESDAARQTLTMRLRSGLLDVRAALGMADPQTRAFGELVCRRIANARKAHPEFYLTSLKSASSDDFSSRRQPAGASAINNRENN